MSFNHSLLAKIATRNGYDVHFFFFSAWIIEMLGSAKGIIDKKEESKLWKLLYNAIFGQEYRTGQFTETVPRRNN